MDTFDWALLKTLMAVADTGTYSGAGRVLGLSQPTVGRHIHELEAELGVTLFQRGKKGYVATENGVALLAEVQLMAESAARIKLKADGQATTIDGTIRISTSEIIGLHYMPKLIVEMRRLQPNLQVELVLNNSNDNLLMREADIAVRMTEPSASSGRSDLITRKVCDISIGMFGSAAYLEAVGAPRSIAELQKHQLIGYDRLTLLIEGIRKYGHKVNRQDFPIRTDNMLAILSLAQAGGGLVFGQVGLCERLGLLRILPELKLPSLPCWLVAHQELKNTARVRFVFDFMVKTLKHDLSTAD